MQSLGDAVIPNMHISNCISNDKSVYKDVRLNSHSMNLMNQILNITQKEADNANKIFVKSNLPSVNRNCHNSNYYSLDRYGLIIRRGFHNDPKSPFGWTYLDERTHEPICIHVDRNLILTNAPNIASITLEKLKRRWGKEFQEKGIYYRVYRELGKL